MGTVQIGPWIVKYDAEATRQGYAQIERGGPEGCGCEPCVNLAAARDSVYPEEVKKVFVQLGIDYSKETEVAHTHRIRPGWHFYLGWLHCVGEVEGILKEGTGYIHVNELFSWSFRNARNLAHEVFSGQPLVQIDFTAEVPWVLEVQEPE